MSTAEADIARFWEDHPCGDQLFGAPSGPRGDDLDRFFSSYDAARYRLESHIPACLDRLHVADKRVLEIGLGQGAESEGLIRRGARWSGLDLTAESVYRVGMRLRLRDLPYENLWQGSATSIPAENQTFDVVFSHGVLHHIPDISSVQAEIHRVLKPGGRLVVMLYAKWSLNYLVSIAVVRRASVLAAWLLRDRIRPGLLAEHLANAERIGLARYLAMDRFLHANTDGPGNPFSRVYDLKAVRRDFPLFRVTASRREFMHAPPLPVHGWCGARALGWHLWVELEPAPSA